MFQPRESQANEISAVILDINDRKRNEAAILAAEERMRLMLDAVAGQVATVDAEGRFAFASPQWCRALGYAAEGELVGMSFYNFFDSEGEAVIRSMLMESIASKSKAPTSGCVTLFSNDCRLLDVRITIVPMLDNPVIDGFVCQMEILRTRSKEEVA